PGIWKLVAKFRSNPQQSYTAEFEVKEYVLPSFEVKLTPVTSFFYVDSPDLIVNIKAEYLFGESVDGTAYVVFGVIAENQKKSLAGSLQRILVERGSAVATLKREHILQTFNNINDLVGKSLFVAVSVLTDSGKKRPRDIAIFLCCIIMSQTTQKVLSDNFKKKSRRKVNYI
ncbi:complement C3, partial [Cynoglossus semilaevis]|uniref:complement C3 n=1 Tax=Cynoglossus semilaevis TaxID=244447 RepID=UPI000497BC8E